MSLTKKIKVAAVAVAITVTMVSAQSARTEALAGAPFGDISDVAGGYAALMTQYLNQVQATVHPLGSVINDADAYWSATASGITSGSFIGIKELNEMISLGLLLNVGPMTENIHWMGPELDSNQTFYETAGDSPGYMNVPRLLLGVDLGSLQIGAEVFFEYARSRTFDKHTTIGTVNTTLESTTSFLLTHPGFRLSTAVDLGGPSLLAKVGMGFPSFNRKTTTEVVAAAGAGTTSNETRSTGALYMEFGGEVTIPLGFDLTVGGEYAFSTHKTETIVKILDGTVTTTTANVPHKNSALEAYAGVEMSVLSNATAAIGYNFRREAAIIDYDTTATAAGQTARANDLFVAAVHLHTVSAGVENVWDEAYFFDNFVLRAGAYYHIFNVRDKEDMEFVLTTTASTTTYADESRMKSLTEYTALVPTLGFGVTKSFFTLDLNLALGSWSGLFNGPGVSTVSATVQF